MVVAVLLVVGCDGSGGGAGVLTKRSRSWSNAIVEVDIDGDIGERFSVRRRLKDGSLARFARSVARSETSGSFGFCRTLV